MPTTTTRLTYDDLDSILREREGDRHEIIDGELVVTPSPIPAHQDVSANITFALQQFVRAHSLGKVYYAPLDIRFTVDNVLIPDVVFIARDRLHVAGPQTVDAAPDLVVEILSPGTRRRDLTVKRDLYARFGVREYWIVGPEDRSLTVFELAGSMCYPVPLRDDGTVQSRLFPGLRPTLEMVFEDVEA